MGGKQVKSLSVFIAASLQVDDQGRLSGSAFRGFSVEKLPT
jgi:hypothetical protein